MTKHRLRCFFYVYFIYLGNIAQVLLFEIEIAEIPKRIKFFSESLILAQNERWRRGLGMQVERSVVILRVAKG